VAPVHENADQVILPALRQRGNHVIHNDQTGLARTTGIVLRGVNDILENVFIVIVIAVVLGNVQSVPEI